MKFMILVKADRNTEAGALPDEKLLAAMGKYNEELAKARVLLVAEGLQPSSKGARVKFLGTQTYCHRRPLLRPADVDRRLLALSGEVEGGGARNGSSAVRIRWRASLKSRFARSSKHRTLAKHSLRS